MPRTKRLRFTMTKKRKTVRKSASVEVDVPSDAEWRNMMGYRIFVVLDAEGEEHTFKQGEVALLLPPDASAENDLGDPDYWVAKIKDIRARSEHDVWVKVQWYYSPQDVADVIKSFKPEHCGLYERIFSDHYDYVQVTCFGGCVSMSRFKEDDVQQRPIKGDEFYCRYNFEYRARTLTPKQRTYACPLCNIPYCPDDPGVEDLMHFCPRPSCRRAYHQKCLLPSYRDRNRFSTTRSLRLISSWPDTDEVLSIADLASAPLAPMKRRRENVGPERSTVGSAEAAGITRNFLGSIPHEMVKIAEQPIIRGAAFSAGGVSGNVASIVSARRMIYETLQGSSIPDDWMNQVDVKASVVERKLPPLSCPQCSGPI
ncbi:hypothetical protein AX17_006991 [Amanita inopinata Kibby_2008]|nr:hypothetical protein AX17_006991 [Amanita inopinata Kibby_2008]